MKNILLFILFICSSNIIKAQDTLSMRSGENILVKVIEVGTTEVKYKKLDNLNGPVFSMLKSDLLMIIYENGTRDIFSSENKFMIKSNPRLSNPFGMNWNLLGQTIVLSLSVDYFITSKINVELGTGIIGTFGGIKYHINGDKNDKYWTPYLGLYLTHMPSKSIGIPFMGGGSVTKEKSFLYFPLGIQLHKSQLNKNKGLDTSRSLFALLFIPNSHRVRKGTTTFGAEIAGTTNDDFFVYGALKFGYHF